MFEFPTPLEILSIEDAQDRHQAYTRFVTEFSRPWLSIHNTSDALLQWMQAFRTLRIHLLDIAWNQAMPEQVREHVEYIHFGSAARDEELPDSDLDYAIVSDGALAKEDILPALNRFNQFMYSVGFPPCDGFVMGTNHRWMGTEDEWMNRIQKYLSFPDWTNARYLYIMVDSLPMSGRHEAWARILDTVHGAIRNSPFLLWEMAHLGIHNSVARTWNGQIRTKEMDGKSYFPVKDGLLGPMIQSVRLLCLHDGFYELSTFQRLHHLQDSKILTPSFVDAIERALVFGWKQRIYQFLHLHGKQDPDQSEAHLDGSLSCKMDFASKVPEGCVPWETASKDFREEALVHVATAKELERLVHRTFPKRGG